MKKMSQTVLKLENNANTPQGITPIRLARRFIETGDARCPLAGLWTELVHSEPIDDDPERTVPAWGFFDFRRAFILP